MSRHVQTYNSSVRVGNWLQDLDLEESYLREFIAKKENGQLLIQRIQNILDTFLKKTELTVTKDGFIHFGDKIMIVNPGQEVIDTPLTQIAPSRPPHTLSINAEESMLYNLPTIKPPCELSASRILNPCKRNTFVVTSVDGTPDGETLCFGQPFTLSSLPGYTGNLKLWSDHIRMNQRARKSKKQLVSFVGETDFNCVWNCLTMDPLQRLETEGLPVPANAKLVIHHCKTGEKLVMLDNVMVRTPFGKEFEVVAQTKLTPHKAESDMNHWTFVTGNPEQSPSALNQRVQKNIDDDVEVNEMHAKDESKKHWLQPKPDDQKPTMEFTNKNPTPNQD